MFALKDLMQRLKVANLDCRQDGAGLEPSLGRSSYVFNSTIEGIEAADVILLIGTNPRVEAAVLNTRIRKRWRQGGVTIGLVGARADLGYQHDYLGAGPQTLEELASGQSCFRGGTAQSCASDRYRRHGCAERGPMAPQC